MPKQSQRVPKKAAHKGRGMSPEDAVTATPESLALRHVWERPSSAGSADLARVGSIVGNHAMAQRLTSSMMIQRAAVKDTQLGGKSLVTEVGADFRNNHMAGDLEKAKTLSKSRVSRSNKNTVVLGSLGDMTTAMSEAPYSATPLLVSGLTWVKVTSRPSRAITPEQVTSQDVEQGTAAVKVKSRLVADDEAKLTASPKSSETGPIVLATGVQG